MLKISVYPASSIRIWTSPEKDEPVPLSGGSYSWDIKAGTNPPPSVLYIEGLESSSGTNDVTISLDLTTTMDSLQSCGTNEIVCSDEIRLTVVNVDLDIDSDNDSGYSLDRTPAEDVLEDDPSALGKVLPVNDLDLNRNSVPDFADGMIGRNGRALFPEASDAPIDGLIFYEMKLAINAFFSGPGNTITFDYDFSDPENIVATAIPDFCGDQVSHTYTPPTPGRLRVWTRPGHEVRLAYSVLDGGHLIVPGEVIPWNTFISVGNVVTLYLEAVKPGLGTIGVEFGPEPWPTTCTDTVKVEATELDMDLNDLIADPEKLILDEEEYTVGLLQIMQSDAANNKVAELIVRRPDPLSVNSTNDRIEVSWSMTDPHEVGNGRIEDGAGNPITFLSTVGEPFTNLMINTMNPEERFTIFGQPDLDVHFHAVRVFVPPGGSSPVQAGSDDVRVNISDERRNRPHLALGGRQARVNRQGVPLPDPDPVGENAAEWDREPTKAYQDMYRLGTYYTVNDISVPIVGGELMVEFRRTLAIDRIKQGGDDLHFANEDVLGHGW
ncbi:MAG: hypothetical protein AAF492_16705, partial [Verrucomicrobiota bacterium]